MSKPAKGATSAAVYKTHGSRELSTLLWTRLCTSFLGLTGNTGLVRAIVFNKINDLRAHIRRKD